MLREVLSVGPTFVVMKFFESKFLFMQNMLWVICFVSLLKLYITSVGESDKCTLSERPPGYMAQSAKSKVQARI